MSTETPAASPSTQTQDKLALLRQIEAMMGTFAQIVKLITPAPSAEAAVAAAPVTGTASAPSQATAAENSSKTVQASRVLLESADKLKELINRPEGTDIKETAQKLGKIIEETSARIDTLLGSQQKAP